MPDEVSKLALPNIPSWLILVILAGGSGSVGTFLGGIGLHPSCSCEEIEEIRQDLQSHSHAPEGCP